LEKENDNQGKKIIKRTTGKTEYEVFARYKNQNGETAADKMHKLLLRQVNISFPI
jgi:hypothetical protein